MISRYGIFCKIIETGSFTKTAELLGYSQSAVSQTIKALEQETGTTLINRRKDGTLLTVDGAAYLPYFQQIYQAEVVVFCLLCNFWKHTFVSMVRFWQFR